MNEPMTSLPWVRSGGVERPLDWLLEAVRQQEVAIKDLAMAPLVARFFEFEYVETAASRNLDLDIEWLLMAATLIQWKSLSLLPGGQRVAADPIRDELVRQLAVHRKEAAAAMRQPGRNPKGYAVQTIEYGIAQVITSLKRCQHTFLPHLEPTRNGVWNFFASKARVWSALSRRPKAGPPSPETIFVCPTSGRSCLSNC